MFSKSSMSLRRFSGIALTLLFLGSFLLCGAQGQTTPVVTASFAQGLNHPSGWGAIEQTAIDSYGDWLVVDYANSALYEFPHGGGAVITLVAAGGLGGGYQNPGIAIDPANNLYLGGNWNNCLLEYPYDTITQTWDGLSALSSANNSSAVCNQSPTSPNNFADGGSYASFSPYYFQPWGIAVGNNDNLILGSQNSGNFIFSLPVNNAWANPVAATNSATEFISAMTERPISVAQDKFGNVYFVEDSGGLSGLYEIPAGETGLASDADATRVDPNLPSVSGVITDSNGNLYVSDSKDGVFMIPNPSGTPETASALSLTTVPAQGEVAIDWTRHIMYVPTTQTLSNGQADVAQVDFTSAEFGAATVGATPAAPQSVSFGITGQVVAPSFKIAEAGASTPDFAVAPGGTCGARVVFSGNQGCTVDVTFNPHSAGSISAKLQMVDRSGNVLASMPLHGTGTAAAVQFAGGAQAVIGGGLNTPGQVAVDPGGNVYVADSGLHQVVEYPQGSASTMSIGTGLVAPTGVAVDGAGDVFIADTGSVYEVPMGSKGLIAAAQITLKTGLGPNLTLAVDGWGNLYILDPDNKRVIELSSVGGTLGPLAQTENDIGGFNTPSAIAVDANGNLYVADGSNLDEVPEGGTLTTLSGIMLSDVTGLATDASGSVYASMAGGTTDRIPNESGILNGSDSTQVATQATAPASVAVDAQGDVYVADSTALNVNITSASAAYDFPTQTTPTGTSSQTFNLVNIGNAALDVTGFASTADYSETATDCMTSAVAVDAACSLTVTFNPGPGDDGILTGEVVVQGNVNSSVVGVNGTGTGYTLAASTTTMVSGGTASADNAPVNVSVAPSSSTSTTTPTGEVTLTVSGNGITPITITEPVTQGAAQFDPQNLTVGSYTFTVAYSGDRTYLRSSATMPITIAPGAVTMTQPASIPSLFPSFQMPASFQSTLGSGTGYLVLSTSTGSDFVYSDSSGGTWTYTYPITVTAANGAPLTCIPVMSGGKLISQNCGSVTYQLSAGNIDCPTNGGTSDQVAVSGVNGSAPLQTGCLEVNDNNTTIPDLMTFYTVTPVFGGTDIYPNSASTTYTGNVNPNYVSFTGTPINFWALRNPVVQISSKPTSLTVASGSSAKATLTLTSLLGYGYLGRGSTLNNYSLPLDLQCDGLPAYASCSFTYPAPSSSDPNTVGVACPAGSATPYCAVNVGPTPGMMLASGSACEQSDGCLGPGTVVMTINANTPTGTVSGLRTDPGGFAFAAMFGFGLLGLGIRKKARRWGGLLLLVCALLCGGGMVGVTACGTTNISPNNASSVTPVGTYNVTVTAKESGFICLPNTQPVGQTEAPCPAGSADAPTYGNANVMSLPYTVTVTIAK